MNLKNREWSKEIKKESVARGCGSRENTWGKEREGEIESAEYERENQERAGTRGTDGAEKRSLPTALGDAPKTR